MIIKLQKLNPINPKLGYAENHHLIINFDEKAYQYTIDMGCDPNGYIEVKRISDLKEYVERLKLEGFTEHAMYTDGTLVNS